MKDDLQLWGKYPGQKSNDGLLNKYSLECSERIATCGLASLLTLGKKMITFVVFLLLRFHSSSGSKDGLIESVVLLNFFLAELWLLAS